METIQTMLLYSPNSVPSHKYLMNKLVQVYRVMQTSRRFNVIFMLCVYHNNTTDVTKKKKKLNKAITHKIAIQPSKEKEKKNSYKIK